MDFSERLLKLRIERNLTQKDLGNAINFSQSAINYWEKGQRIPSIEAAQKLADYFHISLSYLLDGNEFKHESGIPEGKIKLEIGDGQSIFVDPAEFQEALTRIINKVHPIPASKILDDFYKLNPQGQDVAISQVEMLTKIPEYTKEKK